jgi:hypothetical protein
MLADDFRITEMYVTVAPSDGAPATLSLSGAGTNPLSGLPLAPGQVVVVGPLHTGPRQTVVMAAYPSTWPRWITGPAGSPRDDGLTLGGTWQGGGQGLPEIEVTAARPTGLVPLVLVALALALSLRG